MREPFPESHNDGLVFDIEIARRARIEAESKKSKGYLRKIKREFLIAEESSIPRLMDSFVNLVNFAVSGPECASKKFCRRFLLSMDGRGFRVELSDLGLIEFEYWQGCLDVIMLCKMVDGSIWSILEDGMIVWNWLVAHDNYDDA